MAINYGQMGLRLSSKLNTHLNLLVTGIKGYSLLRLIMVFYINAYIKIKLDVYL